jgi:hypothetical protein
VRYGEDVVAVSGPCLVVILPVDAVADVVAFVLDYEWFLVFRFTSDAVAFVGGLLVIMRAISLLTRWPDISKISRRMSTACSAVRKSMPSAPVIQRDHCLTCPRERSRTMLSGGFRVSGAILSKTDLRVVPGTREHGDHGNAEDESDRVLRLTARPENGRIPPDGLLFWVFLVW